MTYVIYGFAALGALCFVTSLGVGVVAFLLDRNRDGLNRHSQIR